MPTSVHYLCEPSVLLTLLIVENVRHKITQKPDNPTSWPVNNTFCWFIPLFLSVTMMLQSFTEGELQHMVGTVLETKRRKSRRLAKTQGRRTKRARKPKSCTVRTLEVKVNELGLEYKSEETVRLRYCSGKCDKHRENYDMVMKHMMTVGFREKGRRDKVSIQPCCRPTAFEDFTVLDTTVNPSRYRNIHNVSAKNCGCVWPRDMDFFMLLSLSDARVMVAVNRKSMEYKLNERKMWICSWMLQSSILKKL